MDILSIIGEETYQEILSQSKEERLKNEAAFNAKNTDLKLQQEILRQKQNVEELKLQLQLASKVYPFEVDEYIEAYNDLILAQSSLEALEELYTVRFA